VEKISRNRKRYMDNACGFTSFLVVTPAATRSNDKTSSGPSSHFCEKASRMPLPMKTLKEAAAELGISEVELKSMAAMAKVRAVMRKGALCIAPDELAKLRRLRKTSLDAPPPKSAPAKPAVAAPPKTGAPAAKPGAPARPTTATPAAEKAPLPKVKLKLPEPPPQ
jgi:hypothetical protein